MVWKSVQNMTLKSLQQRWLLKRLRQQAFFLQPDLIGLNDCANCLQSKFAQKTSTYSARGANPFGAILTIFSIVLLEPFFAPITKFLFWSTRHRITPLVSSRKNAPLTHKIWHLVQASILYRQYCQRLHVHISLIWQ